MHLQEYWPYAVTKNNTVHTLGFCISPWPDIIPRPWDKIEALKKKIAHKGQILATSSMTVQLPCLPMLLNEDGE